jgi:hypothetical protein
LATLTGKDGKTLAPATKRRAIVRLKSVMATRAKMRWLTYDPSADLESPEQKGVTTTAADDIRTPERMTKFSITLRLTASTAGCAHVARSAPRGGRRLRWSDIDLETGAMPLGSRRLCWASCGTRISRGCAPAGIAADVVAAWHGPTERMTQAVYGRVTDDRLTAASAVFSTTIGQN